MTRIIAGTAGGRRLRTPPGETTRPTSDRVREGVFSTVEARTGGLAGLAFLDLYAGSGAVGLEARSRGAGRVLLVERDRRTARLARSNAVALGFGDVEVRAAAVTTLLRDGPAAPGAFDVVFLDPPYAVGADEVHAVLADLVAAGWLTQQALVVVERSARGPGLAWPRGLAAVTDRRYGETRIWYGRRARHDRGTRPEGEPT